MRILLLGAGFGGLELTARISDALGDGAEAVLIDQNDGIVFGARCSSGPAGDENHARSRV